MGIPLDGPTGWDISDRIAEGKGLIRQASDALIKLVRDQRGFAIRELESLAHDASALAQSLRRGEKHVDALDELT